MTGSLGFFGQTNPRQFATPPLRCGSGRDKPEFNYKSPVKSAGPRPEAARLRKWASPMVPRNVWGVCQNGPEYACGPCHWGLRWSYGYACGPCH